MNVVLVGGKHFGCLALHLLLSKSNINLQTVVVTDSNDRLRDLAVKLGVNVYTSPDPKLVSETAIPDDCDLIITAHTHARISNSALEKTTLGGIGYHPSLLPMHRGKHAVEDTINNKDCIAGGTIYQLTYGWDEGNIVLQDWCFVQDNDTAMSLWKRDLSPLGIRLLSTAIDNVLKNNIIFSKPQERKEDA
jgi:methionyl-tRNA formyltransferase